jgi:hypothetical protein
MTSTPQPPRDQPRSRVSLRNQAGNASTATATAAEDALQYVLEKRLRKREGREPPSRPRAPLGAQTPALQGRATVGAGASLQRWGGPQWLVRVGVFCLLTAVIGGSVLRAVWVGGGSYAIAGVVLLAGKPLPNATLAFYQSSGASVPAERKVVTGADGSFQSAADDPLKAGMYAVVVEAVPSGRGASVIPAIYRDPATTPLRMQITENLSGVRLLIRR